MTVLVCDCQVVKKGGTHPGVGALNGGGGQGYGSAVIGVMGDGMETLTLPKLVMQATGVEEASVRAEAYACLARLL